MSDLFLWQCPKVTVSGGLFTKLLMLVIGVFFIVMSIMPGLRIGPPSAARWEYRLPEFNALSFSSSAPQ
jgi:hypothetical protein